MTGELPLPKQIRPHFHLRFSLVQWAFLQLAPMRFISADLGDFGRNKEEVGQKNLDEKVSSAGTQQQLGAKVRRSRSHELEHEGVIGLA